MTEITLKLTFEELKIIDKFVELNDETRPLFDKIRNAYPKPETLLDVIRNLGYSVDMCYEIVDAVEEFEKSKEYQPTSQTPEQVADGLKEAFREAVSQSVVSSVDKPKDDFMDRMVAELKGQNLTNLIYDWWEDVFTYHSEWDMETSIDDLITRIDEWLPKKQSAIGSQNAYVECSVDGFNDCLKGIKGKLR
jgi:hypothetical protein